MNSYIENYSLLRAKVLKVLDSKRHEVYFVDYGNKETVLLENMRLLPLKFRSLPEQALCCSIDNISPLSGAWDETSIDHFKTVVSDVDLKAHLQLERNGTAVIDLEDEEGTVISNLMIELKSAKLSSPSVQAASSSDTKTTNTIIDKGVSRKSPTVATAISQSAKTQMVLQTQTASAKFDQGASRAEQTPVASFKPPLPSVFSNLSKNSEPIDIAVTWIEDERNFWACVVDPELARLVADATDILATTANDDGAFVPSIGQVVGALSSDGCYYRALVNEKEMSNKSYRVLFVDFGNQELVTVVIPLPPGLTNFASPVLQIQSSQPHQITENTKIKLWLESATDNEAEFVLINEESKNVVKVIGKPWYSGHITTEKLPDPTSNTLPSKADMRPVEIKTENGLRVSRPSSADMQAVEKKSENGQRVSRPSSACLKSPVVKAPLDSYLSSLHVQSEPFVAVVTWITDSKNFWISIVDEALKKIAEINATLTESFQKDSINYSSQPGQLVSAKLSDEISYRAYIKGLSGEKAYHVLFVDYGNEADVSAVAPLPPQAFGVPSSAIQMSASEPVKIYLDQVLHLTITTIETSFVTFSVTDQEGKLLEMVAGKPWYSGHLVDNASDRDSPVVNTPAAFSSVPERSLDSTFEANVAWAESAREVYLQRTSDLPQLAELMSEIAHAAEHIEQILAPIVDQVVLALFSDGLWYRAKVLAVSSEEAHVHFIDFGNRAEVTMPELKFCPAEFSKEAPFAIRVSVDGLDDLTLEHGQQLMENAWNVNVTGTAQGLPSVQLVGPNGRFNSPIETETKTESTVTVPEAVPVLNKSETTILEQCSTNNPETFLVAAKTNEEFCTIRLSEQPDVDIPQGEPVKVLISSVCAPTMFYVQYFPTDASMEKWSSLEMEIQAYCETAHAPADYSLEPGQFCLAKFHEDNQWYRAVLLTKLSTSPVTFKVLFVDYGNIEDIDSLLPIPVRLMELPMQAAQCKLHGIIMEDQWSKEVCSALSEETEGKCFEAQMLGKDEDTYIVDIPAVREKMVEMGVLQLDPSIFELDTNNSLPVATTTDVDESCVTSEVLATNDCDQSILTMEVVAPEPAAAAVPDLPASDISNLEKNDEEDLVEQIKLLQAKLAAMQAN